MLFLSLGGRWRGAHFESGGGAIGTGVDPLVRVRKTTGGSGAQRGARAWPTAAGMPPLLRARRGRALALRAALVVAAPAVGVGVDQEHGEHVDRPPAELQELEAFG